MPNYMANKEIRYAGKTYYTGDQIPVATGDVRVLLAIGSIREAPREDRVQARIVENPTEAIPHDAEETDFVHEEHDPADTVSGGAVPHDAEETAFAGETHQDNSGEFQVENTPMLEDSTESETVESHKRAYRTRRMKSED